MAATKFPIWQLEGQGMKEGVEPGTAPPPPTPVIMELRVDSKAGYQGQWPVARGWSGLIWVPGLTDSGDLEWRP